MAITTAYAWTITDTVRDTSDGFITDAYWTLTGVASSNSVAIATCKISGIQNFGSTRTGSEIGYSSVTQANVISWVETGIGTTEVTNFKTNMSNCTRSIIAGIGITPATSHGIPW